MRGLERKLLERCEKSSANVFRFDRSDTEEIIERFLSYARA